MICSLNLIFFPLNNSKTGNVMPFSKFHATFLNTSDINMMVLHKTPAKVTEWKKVWGICMFLSCSNKYTILKFCNTQTLNPVFRRDTVINFYLLPCCQPDWEIIHYLRNSSLNLILGSTLFPLHNKQANQPLIEVVCKRTRK